MTERSGAQASPSGQAAPGPGRPGSGQRAVRFAAILLLVLFTGLSAYVAWREAEVFLTGSRDPARSIPALLDGSTVPGFSTYSSNLVLDDCLHSMSSVYGRVLPAGKRQALLARCDELAMGLAAAAPSYAYAWFVAAYAASEMGQVEAFNTRFRLSQATSPNEFWLSLQRLHLAARLGADLDAGSVAAYRRDIHVGLLTDRAVQALVLAMGTNPALKQDVLKVAAGLPENMQWRLTETMERQGTTGRAAP